MLSEVRINPLLDGIAETIGTDARHDAAGRFSLDGPAMKPPSRRKDLRIDFSRQISARVVAIDGTWQRPCKLSDVSEGGARIVIAGSAEGLQIKEFFLLLSSTGSAYRRCELAWVKGAELGVRFVQTPARQNAQRTAGYRVPAS